MKKFKWPWLGKKKQVKYAPIDISEFKDDLEPFVDRVRDVRAAYEFLKNRYSAAHKALWEKIEKIVGYELPGNWTFDFTNQMLTCKDSEEGEAAELVQESVLPAAEKHWQGMLATFYKDKPRG